LSFQTSQTVILPPSVFPGKSISPVKLIELFFWQDIMETFQDTPEKIHSFSTFTKQVWSEEEINIVNLCLRINWCRLHFAHRLWARLAKPQSFHNIMNEIKNDLSPSSLAAQNDIIFTLGVFSSTCRQRQKLFSHRHWSSWRIISSAWHFLAWLYILGSLPIPK